VVLAKEKYGLRGRDVLGLQAHFVPFSARTRMSGVDMPGRAIRKGAADAVEAHVRSLGGTPPSGFRQLVDTVARQGETPLVVSEGARVLGVIRLKDIVKGGMRERFAELRKMGIKTIMITGDNPLTAAAIAAEAGVDDFLAQATPEDKLAKMLSSSSVLNPTLPKNSSPKSLSNAKSNSPRFLLSLTFNSFSFSISGMFT
jgi:K+-transporting ATPase ATPase B chain